MKGKQREAFDAIGRMLSEIESGGYGEDAKFDSESWEADLHMLADSGTSKEDKDETERVSLAEAKEIVRTDKLLAKTKEISKADADEDRSLAGWAGIILKRR